MIKIDIDIISFETRAYLIAAEKRMYIQIIFFIEFFLWFPEPKTCIIDQDELVDGLRVLVFKDGLFYEGAVKAIRPPDVYGVVIDNARGNRPYIYSQEEILKEVVRMISEWPKIIEFSKAVPFLLNYVWRLELGFIF